MYLTNKIIKELYSYAYIVSSQTKNVESVPVRMMNGNLVKGLRSDHIATEKLKQQRSNDLQMKIDLIRAAAQSTNKVRFLNLRVVNI